MREATALKQRAEYRVPGESQPVVAGYRKDGSLSVYFGPDPCFHFDAAGRLRRAFSDGDLFRTQGSTLARLRRLRPGDSVELRRQDLSANECERFLEAARHRLTGLLSALSSGDAECLADHPDDVPLLERLREHLTQLVERPLTLAPAIRGKR